MAPVVTELGRAGVWTVMTCLLQRAAGAGDGVDCAVRTPSLRRHDPVQVQGSPRRRHPAVAVSQPLTAGLPSVIGQNVGAGGLCQMRAGRDFTLPDGVALLLPAPGE